MPIIYPKLYVRTALDGTIDILDNVTDHRRVTIPVRKGTYRNSGTGAGSLSRADIFNDLSPTALASVPVIGAAGELVGTTETAIKAKLTYPRPSDEVLGIPPRPYFSLESAHALAIGDAVIPPPETPPTRTVTFTRSVDICQSISAHGFANGDVVAAHGALPAPLLSGKFYSVLVVSVTEFRLVDLGTGLPVTLTAAGSGLAVLQMSIAPPPATLGVFYYLDAWKPRFSTSKPII